MTATSSSAALRADAGPDVVDPIPAGTVPLVVVGPRTRVGRSLLALREGPVLAVSRHADDTAALAGADVLDVEDDDLGTRLAGASAVDVAVCALGPVHPGAPDHDRDVAGLRRDLGLLRRVLAAADGRPVRIVLVSSVVALAPTPDRRYYGGAKSLVEQLLLELVAAHPHARLDVLYPGRLLAAGEGTRPWHRLHARFDRVAAHVERALRASQPLGRRRVVGLDARLWLAVRSLSLVVQGLRPGRVDPSAELVEPKVAP
ncbi:hypothetical protein QE370_002404 [Aeromicrobium sp. SORGH_AS981]|uniref:hypothetical protein n=2 Tax=unclassified Aeromicrobium TaxID=2633570 RepID=UPI002866EDF3|nr:hypothetical protein [Aeromicrobium sp. SORGH_AS_0981]MDR6119220.1 hypothetical protein [Aeromicrobium sp. SORGH_AS_0981]